MEIRFDSAHRDNADSATVEGFGFEWGRFNQSGLAEDERRRAFADYFSIFPWELLPDGGGVGADIGCGSGRWSVLVAPRVARLHLVDASPGSLEVARRNLSGVRNVEFHLAPVGRLPLAEESLDFAFSLGVLHHVPDPPAALRSIAGKLKGGAPLLLYLYYRFDNRPVWYRSLWRITDLTRRVISGLPGRARYTISQACAAVIYLPLARAARMLDGLGAMPEHWPLKCYRKASFYTMRTDALDRFGTRLEQRFTRPEIRGMLETAGFESIRFSESPPYWCVVGVKRPDRRECRADSGCAGTSRLGGE